MFVGDQLTTQSADSITGGTGTDTFRSFGFQGATAGSAGVTETNVVTFTAVQVGKFVNVGGLILTVATADVTAANIAAAAAGATVTNVTKSGALIGWTPSATTGATVTFLSATPNTNVAPITIVSDATTSATVTTETNGSAATAATAQSVLPTMVGIDTLALMSQANNADFNFTTTTLATTGVSLIQFADVSLLSGRTITTTIGQTLGLATAAGAATAGKVTFATAAANTSPTLVLNGYQGARTASASAVDITGGGAVTQNIVTAVAASKISTLTLAATTTSLVVSGNQNLAIGTDLISGTTATTLTSVNASALTGNFSVKFAAATNGLFTFTGGSGNDTVTLAANGLVALTSGAQLNGGSGSNDTLGISDTSLTTALYAKLNQATNFETLGLNAAITVDASQLTSIKNFSIGTAAVAATINNMAAGATFSTAVATGITVIAGAVGVNSVNVNLGTSTSNSLTVDSLTIRQTSVNLNSSGFADQVNTITTLVNADNSTYTITGTNALTITNATEAVAIGSVYNAAGLVGALTIIGNDTAFAAGSALGDTIIGGSGRDTITASVNSATLTGGSGIDAFSTVPAVAGGTTAVLFAFTTITDLAPTETILLKDKAAPVFHQTAANVSTANTLNAAINIAATADAGTNASVKWFNWTDGNTYMVNATTGNATALATGDQVVKLIGTFNLSNSTIDGNALFTFV